MSASEALFVGAGGVFLPVALAGAAEAPEEPDEAGALAAGAGVGAGAGVEAGAAEEFPEAAAEAVPASLFVLLWDDFLAEDVSAAGVAEDSAPAVSAFLDLEDDFLEVEVSAAGADEEFSAAASDFLLLLFPEVVFDEAAAEESAELSDAAVSAFFDFLDFLDLVLEELWSLLEALWDCAQPTFMKSARRKHNDITNARVVFIVYLS